MPKKKAKAARPKGQKSESRSQISYRRKPRKVGSSRCDDLGGTPQGAVLPRRPNLNPKADQQVSPTPDLPHAHVIAPAHFTLRDDGTISGGTTSTSSQTSHKDRDAVERVPPSLIFQSDAPFLRLYHGNGLELLDAIVAKYPDGRFGDNS